MYVRIDYWNWFVFLEITMRSITAQALTYIGSDPMGGLTEKELSLP